jgi:hypothetical protein
VFMDTAGLPWAMSFTVVSSERSIGLEDSCDYALEQRFAPNGDDTASRPCCQEASGGRNATMAMTETLPPGGPGLTGSSVACIVGPLRPID